MERICTYIIIKYISNILHHRQIETNLYLHHRQIDFKYIAPSSNIFEIYLTMMQVQIRFIEENAYTKTD